MEENKYDKFLNSKLKYAGITVREYLTQLTIAPFVSDVFGGKRGGEGMSNWRDQFYDLLFEHDIVSEDDDKSLDLYLLDIINYLHGTNVSSIPYV